MHHTLRSAQTIVEVTHVLAGLAYVSVFPKHFAQRITALHTHSLRPVVPLVAFVTHHYLVQGDEGKGLFAIVQHNSAIQFIERQSKSLNAALASVLTDFVLLTVENQSVLRLNSGHT